jgi:hypothetical protein
MQENQTPNTSNIAINSNMISLETAEKSLNTMCKMLKHMRLLNVANDQDFRSLVKEYDTICIIKNELKNSTFCSEVERKLPREEFYKLVEKFDAIISTYIKTAGDIYTTD